MKKFLVLMLFLAGCAFKSLPELNLYTIKPIENVALASKYPTKILKVAYPIALSRELGFKMAFVYENGKSGYYLNSQWQEDIGKLIEYALITSLEKAHIFKAVVPYNSTVLEDYRLEITINRLYHKVVTKNNSYAILDVTLNLLNMDTRAIIKHKRFFYKIPCQSTNAKGYAKALQEAIDAFVKDVIAWL